MNITSLEDTPPLWVIVEENTIKNIKIRPSGCSISIASASIMAEAVVGLTIAEIEAMIKLVNEAFSPTPQTVLDEWP